jgi:hypothetical protein
MALAVSAAVVATALLAVAELTVSDRLSPFTKGFWKAASASGLCITALWAAGIALAPLGAPVRATGLLLLFWPLLWMALRFGLEAEDKAALGKAAIKLRL